MKERYLRSIRLLAECYQRFNQLSEAEIRLSGLTPAQFDIIATLGNTPGMSFKELGEKTLITKGTLTGVVDRLESKGLVLRMTQAADRRSTLVQLTEQGQAEFERVFAPHIQFCKQPFTSYSDEDFSLLERELEKLNSSLAEIAAKTQA